MTLQEQIVAAFAHREIPDKALEMEGLLQIDSDVEETLWFEGRHWRTLTLDDWHQHYCAVTFFSPEAFRYYLQSLLVLTVENPQHYPDLAVDSFVWALDRTAGIENWDPSLTDRYFGLNDAEYQAIKEWLVWASENVPDVFYGAAVSGPGDGFGRAFDTVAFLQQEAVKRRALDSAAESL